MPTYEYECEKCAHHFEKFQSITEDPVKRCPKCSHKVRRLIGTGSGIIFKGSGFYATDYRSPTYQDRVKKDKAPSEPASSNKTSGESTPPPAAASKKDSTSR